jgi:membrane fusion protein (multidrug efflux system)
MRKRMLLMLIAVIGIIAILGFIKFQQIKTMIAQNKSFTPPPDAVTTVVAKTEPWDATLEATGSVYPVQGVTLSADQPGIVDKIAFTSGAHVAAGAALVLLDTRQEHAQLASAEAQRDLAQSKLARAKKLLEQQLISQSDYDDSNAQFKQADAAVNEMKATIERKTIRAPFSGRCGIRQVNLGQYVHSGDPIVPIQTEDPIYVNFSVPQQTVRELHVGGAVIAAADSGAKAGVTGRITAINPVVDEQTRNVDVQATFHNPGGRLRAGAYVTVTIELGAHAAVVALPASAINYAPYGNSVFIVEMMKGPDGKSYKGVRQQFVKVGDARGDRVVILSGVKDGEEVVSSGVFKLRSGAPVQVNNKVQPSDSLSPRPAES